MVAKIRAGVADKIKFEFEKTFMFYLPRICEHCLNPSCVASCPSGAIYKRAEDGIVLVDQDQCRGWRQCITGCPYKKVYFNHKTGKAEKCTFCYPRVEVGLPTVCAETCVGRLRYIGLFLYDADAVTEAASIPDEKDLYEAQLDVILDPHDPEVIAGRRARRDPRGLDGRGAAVSGLRAGQEVQGGAAAASGVPHHADGLVHPTALAGCRPAAATRVTTRESAGDLFGAIDALRIPMEYLAELFTAGDTEVDRRGAAAAWPRCAPTCATSPSVGGQRVHRASVGMTARRSTRCTGCWRSPSTRTATSSRPRTTSRPTTSRRWAARSTSTGDRGMGGSGPFGEASGRPVPVAVETFHALKQRQTSEQRSRPARPCRAG